MDDRNSRDHRDRSTILTIAGLAAGVHAAVFFSAGPLWRDEANNAALAALSWSGLWRSLEMDSFPPLYATLVRLWVRCAGGGDGALRLFGSATGVALLITVGVLLPRLTRRAPTLALALLAVNPALVIWGDSLRAYGLAAASLAAAYVFYGRAALDGAGADLLWACAASILALQTAYQTAPLLCAVSVCAAAVAWRREGALQASACIAALVLALLTLAPYAAVLARYREAYVVRQLPFDPRSAAWSVREAVGGTAALAVWIALPTAALASVWRRRETSDAGQALSSYGGGVLVATAVFQTLFLTRTAYSVQPWYLILPLTVAGLAVDTVWSTFVPGSVAFRLRTLLAGAAVLSVLPVLAGRCVERRTNIDLAALRVAEDAGADDLVVVHPWFDGVSFSRYYRGRTPWTTVPPLADHSIHRYDLVKERMIDPSTARRQLAEVRAVLDKGGRVWLLGGLPTREAPGEKGWDAAPAPPGGWRSDLYADRWARSLRGAIEASGFRFVPVELGFRGRVNPYEDIGLWKSVRDVERPPTAKARRG